MIRTSQKTNCRAAAAFLVAVALTLTSTHRASAQQTVDLFGGTLGTPTSLGATATGLNLTTVSNGTFGVTGYSGTVTIGALAVGSAGESFASLGSSNSYSINQVGLLSAASSVQAMKTFTGTSLTPGATYALTLTRSTGFTVGLLGNVNVSLSEGGNSVLGNTSGVGVLGVVDVLGLFGGSNTSTYLFTVPAGSSGNLLATFNTNLTTTVLGGNYTFTSASVTQVPEPTTTAAAMIGAAGLVVLRCRRRLRAAL